MTNNRTNELIVAEALAGGKDYFWEYPNSDQDRERYLSTARETLDALRAANRLAGEPSEEQVERAAIAFTCETQSEWDASPETYKQMIREDMRSALTAAGVAPQAESPRDLLSLAKYLHQKFGRNQPDVWGELPGALQNGWLVEAENIPHAAQVQPSSDARCNCAYPEGHASYCPLRPVQPSSTEDEGELEHVIEEAIRDTVDMPLSTRLVLARAVVEAIGGEGL